MKAWEWGRTLRGGKGSTQSTPAGPGRTVRSLYAGGIAIVATIAAAIAMVLALTASPLPGLVIDASGGFVASMDPGGFAWRSGIRPGQRVIAMSAVDDEGGWSIETADATGRQRASVGAATDTLRLSTPLAAMALVLGLLALVAVPTRRRRAELLASLSLTLAAVPMWLAGDAILATLVGILGPVAIAIWALRWLGLQPLVAAVLGAVLVAPAIAYAVLRSQGSAMAADLDGIRLVGTMALAAGVLMVGLDRRPGRLVGSVARVRLLDAAVGVVVISVATIVVISFAMPFPIVATVAVIVVLAYVALRTGVARLLDRVFLAEVRERAAVQGADEERARLSRDLHDDPLQALAGVIHRLERQPDTAEDRAALRTVAAHLRDVATELHPPVLDDLGLVPAIEGLRPTDTGIAVGISVTQGGYERAQRPPAEIEIAVYRIVQEAVANAIRHSGCRTIQVGGTVSHDHVAIDVIDDGQGVTDRDIETAMRGGHIGVASMRRRADAIDARLTHRGTPGSGTTVSVRWQA